MLICRYCWVQMVSKAMVLITEVMLQVVITFHATMTGSRSHCPDVHSSHSAMYLPLDVLCLVSHKL